MCNVMFYFPVCHFIKFETDFLIPAWSEKSGQKIKFLKNEKRFYVETKKLFSSFLKWLSLKQTKLTFLEYGSPTLRTPGNNTFISVEICKF